MKLACSISVVGSIHMYLFNCDIQKFSDANKKQKKIQDSSSSISLSDEYESKKK